MSPTSYLTAPPRVAWAKNVSTGSTAVNPVVFATGHGMLGVTLGPLTGRLVAAVVRGDAAHPALARLSPERF